MRSFSLLILAFLVFCLPTHAQEPPIPASAAADTCNQPLKNPITMIDLPGNPFEPVPTSDGCWIFVSLSSASRPERPGIAVLKRSEGRIKLERVAYTAPGSTGIVLTHDGKLLIVAQQDNVVFMATDALISGHGNPILGEISDGRGAGVIYVNVTADDRFLFASDERHEAITVVNLERARSQGFNASTIVGRIPAGLSPIALTFSPDERYLYTTSEVASNPWNWPEACTPEGPQNDSGRNWPQGAIMVVDVARAEADPGNSVLARIPAGCSPVRLQLSPSGDRAYVSARGSNALLVFNTGKLLTDSANARIATVPVGTAPVGISLVDGGAKVVVANSNRFSGGSGDKENLTVIDTASIASNHPAVLGSIPAGAFPRELRLTADGRTLLLTNFASSLLEVIDLNRLSLQPNRN